MMFKARGVVHCNKHYNWLCFVSVTSSFKNKILWHKDKIHFQVAEVTVFENILALRPGSIQAHNVKLACGPVQCLDTYLHRPFSQ